MVATVRYVVRTGKVTHVLSTTGTVVADNGTVLALRPAGRHFNVLIPVRDVVRVESCA